MGGWRSLARLHSATSLCSKRTPLCPSRSAQRTRKINPRFSVIPPTHSHPPNSRLPFFFTLNFEGVRGGGGEPSPLPPLHPHVPQLTSPRSASSRARHRLRERLQSDLKKEIKKLQRYRDQVKTWAGSTKSKTRARCWRLVKPSNENGAVQDFKWGDQNKGVLQGGSDGGARARIRRRRRRRGCASG